ncbi:hypothetical protein E1A91_D10G162900v1 [Gossypium mustelinum]|uniref:Uncharacterized protein n=1 Tax=Gossypium mustelinum TaxID=34275 RepID=A0A5D2TA00_GOSMU|nr:hypothetical protein E1A91_D10G162900v1 [Gossypium mustelinum]
MTPTTRFKGQPGATDRGAHAREGTTRTKETLAAAALRVVCYY